MRIVAVLLALLIAGAAGTLRADQADARLDGLFAALGLATSEAAAAPIEEQIWAIWHEIDDPASARLLRQGSDAMARQVFPVALLSFDRLTARSPDFAEGWNRRATLHFLLGDDEASIRDIEETLRLEPRHFGALSGLGLIMLRNDQPEAALRSFEAALELHPHLPGARQHVELLRSIVEGAPT